MTGSLFTLVHQIRSRAEEPDSPPIMSLYEFGNKELWFEVLEKTFSDIVFEGDEPKPVLFKYLREVKVIDPRGPSGKSRPPKKEESELIIQLVAHIAANCSEEGIVFRDDRKGYLCRQYLQSSYYCHM